LSVYCIVKECSLDGIQTWRVVSRGADAAARVAVAVDAGGAAQARAGEAALDIGAAGPVHGVVAHGARAVAAVHRRAAVGEPRRVDAGLQRSLDCRHSLSLDTAMAQAQTPTEQYLSKGGRRGALGWRRPGTPRCRGRSRWGRTASASKTSTRRRRRRSRCRTRSCSCRPSRRARRAPRADTAHIHRTGACTGRSAAVRPWRSPSRRSTR